MENWRWRREYLPKWGSGDRDGVKIDLYPRPHPLSEIDLYPHPHWRRGFFPNIGWGPNEGGKSLPYCHPYTV